MLKVIFAIDRISIYTGKLFAWCILILAVAIGYEVFMRYALRSPTAWAYDAGYMLYGALFIMAGAYALARGAHIRGDVIYRLWRPRTQAWLEFVLYILFFFPAVVALVYSGYEFARLSWLIGERSTFSPAGPPLYHFKTLIPIAGGFLFLQGIAEVMRCFWCIRHGHWPARVADVEEIDREVLGPAAAELEGRP